MSEEYQKNNFLIYDEQKNEWFRVKRIESMPVSVGMYKTKVNRFLRVFEIEDGPQHVSEHVSAKYMDRDENLMDLFYYVDRYGHRWKFKDGKWQQEVLKTQAYRTTTQRNAMELNDATVPPANYFGPGWNKEEK